MYDEIATVDSDMEIKKSWEMLIAKMIFRKMGVIEKMSNSEGYKYMLLYVLKMEKDFDNFLRLDCVRRFRTTLI